MEQSLENAGLGVFYGSFQSEIPSAKSRDLAEKSGRKESSVGTERVWGGSPKEYSHMCSMVCS